MYHSKSTRVLTLHDRVIHRCVDVLRYFTGFHKELESNAIRCSEYVKRNARYGDASSVIAAMDAFAKENSLMHIGGDRGAMIDGVIHKSRPSVMAEVGAYIGYSAIRFATVQREALRQKNKDGQYITFEYSPAYAEISQQMIEYAGLAGNIQLIVGAFSEKMHVIKETKVDMLFLDHAKELYTCDLCHALNANILSQNAIIIADNVLYPGAPGYLDYFKENPQQFDTNLHTFKVPAIGGLLLKDGVHVAVRKGSAQN